MPTGRIMVVDDDEGMRVTMRAALILDGFTVASAANGADAIILARTICPDIAIVDQSLPDMLGTHLIAILRERRPPPEIMLCSAFLTTAITVEAMKLGAFDVLEKPFDLETLVQRVRLRSESQRRGPALMVAHGSAAERWATLVINACEADVDLRTMTAWAHFAGVSYSALSELCRIVDVRPHDARDFVRMLRAVIQSSRFKCRPEALLDVGDRRTLKALLARSVLGLMGTSTVPSAESYLSRQEFVSPHNEAVRIVCSLLAKRTPEQPVDDAL
jgi:DNA-binding response OmpR family regulator